jgi:predicted phosphodiesterase
MKFLVYADLHSIRKANMLMKFVESEQPDLAFGLGDFNGEFNSVLNLCNSKIPSNYIIYGNHDSLVDIQKYPKWLSDGVHEINGLRVYAVNGIWGTHPELKPYQRNVRGVIRAMKDIGPVDILLTHEHPYGLDYHHPVTGTFKFKEERDWHRQFAEAVADLLKPKMWYYGHSYSVEACRMIPELNLWTIGLDGRFMISDSELRPVKVEEIAHVPF